MCVKVGLAYKAACKERELLHLPAFFFPLFFFLCVCRLPLLELIFILHLELPMQGARV